MRWVHQLDSALLGGPQSTFLGLAVVGGAAIGAAAGDSRAYLLGAEGGCRVLSDSTRKARLGSGEVEPVPIRVALAPRDVLLLLSDGAWTPLSPYLLEKAARAAALRHFGDVPEAVLDAASRTGRADDMTAIAIRMR